MDADDFDDDDVAAPSAFLPPADRLWRHPSELAALASGSMGTTAVVEQHRPAWQVALAAGVAGAAAVAAVVMLTGGFSTRIVERTPRAGLGAFPVLSQPTASPGVATSDVLAGAAAVSPSLGHVATADGHRGTAVVVRADGHLVTDARVLAGARNANITLPDGRTLPGDVVGTDDETGLAVLWVDADDLVPAAMGSAADLVVGEPAIAIGAPALPSARTSATVGVVQSLGVEVVGGGGDVRHDLVSTDAPLGAGSAGGVLLDRHGAVVGITTAVPADLDRQGIDADRVAFAVPIDIARAVTDDLIDSGTVRPAWLGIVGSDIDAAASITTGTSQGVLLHDVTIGSAAADAGLRAGDVVVAWAGHPVRTMAQLVIRLRAQHPGDPVAVTVLRAGTRHELPLVLDVRPAGATTSVAPVLAAVSGG